MIILIFIPKIYHLLTLKKIRIRELEIIYKDTQEKISLAKNFNIKIGEQIRKKRERLNISREDMAEILDVTPNFLGDVERGQKSLSLQKLFSFCNVFNMNLDNIIQTSDSDFMNYPN